MGFIENELDGIKKLAERKIRSCKLVCCVKTMVRAEIKLTDYKKIIACMQFPENYPECTLLIELKSKTLSEKLIQGLTNVCETEAKKYLGRPQIMPTLAFLENFLIENPLSCCHSEIGNIKRLLVEGVDELKLKQKSSSIFLSVVHENYFWNVKIFVPNNYPVFAIELKNAETNLPPTLQDHIFEQGREIARQCVEPPLKKPKPNDPPFKPQPSLEKTVCFFINYVKQLPSQVCQFCKEQCLPSDPQQIEKNKDSPRHLERIFCGHLFHQECLFNYLKTPPFGNKRCSICGEKICHHKWSLSDKLAENRWAHEQARERELAEVEDFFN